LSSEILNHITLDFSECFKTMALSAVRPLPRNLLLQWTRKPMSYNRAPSWREVQAAATRMSRTRSSNLRCLSSSSSSAVDMSTPNGRQLRIVALRACIPVCQAQRFLLREQANRSLFRSHLGSHFFLSFCIDDWFWFHG
jgi:hypothetical protein